MMKRYAVTGAVLGSALALTSLTACGSDTKSKTTSLGDINLSASQVVLKTAEKSAAVDTFGADLTVDGTVKVHGTGKFRIKPNTAFTVNLDQIGVGGTSFAGTGGTHLVYVDQNFYVQNSKLGQLLGASKPWMKVSLADIGQKSGVNVGDIVKQAEQANPADLTKIMTVSKDVKKVGTESVNGVQTNHFRGTVGIKDAAAQLSPELQKRAQTLGSNADVITFDLWTDAENLPRKVVTTAKASEGPFTVTALFSDYGKSVNVSAPPADQTGPLTIP